ncbi:WYL domain-containing protein [Streptomyces syringium]|uniref:WYL domain-containing protein n=1 Tax=Streptomyces syringium TaxID=76729 RepID=A0ABS4XVP2_9ACTN|nr:hypothetical protein [Streptomyces syringium]MBP2400585.1 hypothetical protein [Streptomyces syringium]
MAALSRAATVMTHTGPAADPGLLADLAAACMTSETARFTHTPADGQTSRRHAEPKQVVTSGRCWYLLAATWTARAGAPTAWAGSASCTAPAPAFSPRDLPGGQDPATDLADAWTNAPGMLRARLLGSSDTATEPSFTRLPVGGIHVTRLRPRDTGATVTAPKRQAVMEPAELQAKGEGAAKR